MKVSLLDRIRTKLSTGYDIDPIVYKGEACIKYKDIYLDIAYSEEADKYCVTWQRDLPPGVLAREVQYVREEV